MILKLPERYSLLELMAFVRKQQPKKIHMTPEQGSWYKVIVNQRTFDRPLKFMGLEIEVVD